MAKPFYTRSIPIPLLGTLRREARQCGVNVGTYLATVLDEIRPEERLKLFQRQARRRADSITERAAS